MANANGMLTNANMKLTNANVICNGADEILANAESVRYGISTLECSFGLLAIIGFLMMAKDSIDEKRE
jgi:hypothetical protein